MGGYSHKCGNGIVKSIADTSKLLVSPSDDNFQLVISKIGNFTWWYFDFIDAQNNYLLNDSLRIKFFPQFARSIKTPTTNQALTETYSISNNKVSTLVFNVILIILNIFSCDLLINILYS